MTEPQQGDAYQIDANRVIDKLNQRLSALTAENVKLEAMCDQLAEERNSLAQWVKDHAEESEADATEDPKPASKAAPRKAAAKKAAKAVKVLPPPASEK